MPRGQHPNSLANLKKGKRFSASDGSAKANAEKSVEARRSVKSFQTIVSDYLTQNDGAFKDALARRLIKMAGDGNLSALQYVVKLIGEEPADRVEVSRPAEEVAQELRDVLDRRAREIRGDPP